MNDNKQNRAGKFVKVEENEYCAFVPSTLQSLELSYDNESIVLIGKANQHIGMLNALSAKIPSINLFVSSYVQKEALMSSQIEGTQTNFSDIFDPDIDLNVNSDVEDVVNYTNAQNFAWNEIEKIPLCNRLLKQTHKILMDGVRGSNKNPGEFRRSQNWIGGSRPDNAMFVPPTVLNMEQAMSDLEKFANEVYEIDPLVKAALIHYQFETIHPFLDGNGRLGRMLISLYLKEANILTYPVLYISYYFKMYRTDYYDRLSEVRKSGDFEQWIKFFLRAVISTCQDCISAINKISQLYEAGLARVEKSSSSKTIKPLFDYIHKHPIINITNTVVALDSTHPTITSAIKKLIELEILREETSNRRNRIFVYKDYIDILAKDTENLPR